MIHIKQAIIVEGRYDKMMLSGIIEALIVEVNGFQIYKDKEKLEYIKKLAEDTGIVVLTDSDAAGFQIRAKLSSVIPENQIFHAYIPDIYGKEKRKNTVSKEGKLGVEGMTKEVIISSLERAGIEVLQEKDSKEKLVPADMFALGLSGSEGSKSLRGRVLAELGLPLRMSTKALMKAMSVKYTREEAYNILAELITNEGGAQ